tara:strand:- start:219 stop:716 length:498 start_codon:yes stop_codon:yes gene_type:complete
MKNKHVGFMVMGIAVLLFFIVLSFNNALEVIVKTSCVHGDTCPMQVTLDTQERISYGLMGLLLLFGGFMAFFMKDVVLVSGEIRKGRLSDEKKKRLIENLNEEEKKIVDLIQAKEGSVYQSDLIKESGINKVKVTRILDGLEGKGLVERKRRGMTNIVILDSVFI